MVQKRFTINTTKCTLALPRGKANAITMEEYARRLGITDGTATAYTARRVVRALDMIGIPVCTNTKGVWLATGAHDVKEYREQLIGRALSILDRVRALEITAEELRRDGLEAVLARALPTKEVL
jgi:hypothetical protein